MQLNIRSGFSVYAPRFYFGFSYLPLVNAVFTRLSMTAEYPNPYYRGVIQAGYSFPVSATMDVKPSILALWQNGQQIYYRL